MRLERPRFSARLGTGVMDFTILAQLHELNPSVMSALASFHVAVGQQHRIDGRGVERRRIPVAQPQLLQVLERSAVHSSRRPSCASRYLEPVSVPVPPRKSMRMVVALNATSARAGSSFPG